MKVGVSLTEQQTMSAVQLDWLLHIDQTVNVAQQEVADAARRDRG